MTKMSWTIELEKKFIIVQPGIEPGFSTSGEIEYVDGRVSETGWGLKIDYHLNTLADKTTMFIPFTAVRSLTYQEWRTAYQERGMSVANDG